MTKEWPIAVVVGASPHHHSNQSKKYGLLGRYLSYLRTHISTLTGRPLTRAI